MQVSLNCGEDTFDFHQIAELKAVGRKFESEEHRRRWISRVVHNLQIDACRKERRRVEILRMNAPFLTRKRDVVTLSERVFKVIDLMPDDLAMILRMKIDNARDTDVANALWNDGSDAARVRARRLCANKAFPLFRKIWDDMV